jgi:glycosyltransferase involved in cell wall biosynthesis
MSESIVITEPDDVSRPTVSIIIPTYDYAQLISQALESVQSQSYEEWECVVVDDGSTDNTEDVVASYSKQDPRIRFIRQANQRQAAARNTGIKNSAGTYIQFLDADDLIEPRKLELQVAYLEQHPEVDITYSGVRYFTADHVDERLLSRQYSSWEGAGAWMPEITGEGKVILPVLLRNNIMVVNSPLLRRRVVDQVGLFDVGLTPVEDWDYWIRCAAKGLTFRFHDFAESRALVRAHDMSSSKDQRRMLRATLLMRQKLATLLVDKDLRELNQQRLVEAEGHLGIEEVINGSMSTGLYQILKAATLAPRLRFKAKWLLCAWSAPFVSHDRLRQMVTSSLIRSSGNGKSRESD